MLQKLAFVYLRDDATMVEVNPLVTTKDGRVVCLDGKMSIDSNALFRQRTVAGMRDENEEDPTEVRARKAGLSYVNLDGNIGCLVNGAGLAMATMDIIKLYGGEPANFLDVGGSASTEQVTTAFQIILEDPAVKGIFVNIFGGIMRCDVVAQGVVDATRKLGLECPLVVRLHGTNMKEGKAILASSGFGHHARGRHGRRRAQDRGGGAVSILVNKKTRVLTQGITGEYGMMHTLACREYGTNIVGGVTPGRGGKKVKGIPVYDTVSDAVEKTGANATMIFVPAAFAADAVEEAVDAGIELIVCITEGIPALDEARMKLAVTAAGARMVGPNCPGVISPGERCKVGIMPGFIHRPGRVGVVSRSGTLTYEAVWQLSELKLGQSTCVGDRW